MEKLPKVTKDEIKEVLLEVSLFENQIKTKEWLDTRLTYIQQNNTELYDFIISRILKFVNSKFVNYDTLTIFLAFEFMLLLEILNRGLGNKEEMEKFSSMMKDWFGGDYPSGLDDFGKKV